MTHPNSEYEDEDSEKSGASKAKGVRGVVEALRSAFQDDLAGEHHKDLRDAQRDVVLSRTLVLIGIAYFVVPTTCLSYVYFIDSGALDVALAIVGGNLIGISLVRFAVKAGYFARFYHLAMFVLVGVIFGFTASAITEITRRNGGDFFFAYFLIYFAFTALYPASVRWILATSGMLMVSWILGRVLTAGSSFGSEVNVTENVLYLFQLTFIGVVLNRVVTRLFMAERRAQLELREARDSLQAEMDVAQQIQTLMLPKEPVLADHLVSGLMLPADEVGGDYYDLIQTKSGRSFVVIGDVSGHGLTSGLTMMMARASLLGALEGDEAASLPTLYNALNRCLRENLIRMDLSLYMTFALFEYTGDGKFEGVGAHPPPIVWRAEKQEVQELSLQGTWLGIVDEIGPDDLPICEVQLGKGDILLMYTDGIVESESVQGEMFGFERLGESLQNLSHEGMSELVRGLVKRMKQHTTAQDDDVTLFAVKYVGEGLALN